MAIIYTVANQKGGSGKTTTAAAIASGATFRGKKSLAVDLDSQYNLTFIMGADPNQPGAFEMITGIKTPAIQHTEQGDVIAGSAALASADSILKGNKRIYALRDALKVLENYYDYIVIDTGPALSTLLLNALTASSKVIIPLRAKMTHLQGLYLLAQTINDVKEKYNPGLEVSGILFTEYNGRTLAAQSVTQAIKEAAAGMGYNVFQTTIRQGVAVDESQILRESIFTSEPNAKVTQDYLSLLDELGI